MRAHFGFLFLVSLLSTNTSSSPLSAVNAKIDSLIAGGYLPIPASDIADIADISTEHLTNSSTPEVSSNAPAEPILYKCETSPGSPTINDVFAAAHKLWWGVIIHKNCADPWSAVNGIFPKDWKCFARSRYATAVVGLCKSKWDGQMTCGELGSLGMWVGKKCGRKGLAGGKVEFPDRGIVVYIYHTRNSR